MKVMEARRRTPHLPSLSEKRLSLFEPGKYRLFGLLEFPQDRLPVLLRPDNRPTSIWFRAIQKSLMIAFHRIHIIHLLPPSIRPHAVLEPEGPQQFRNRQKHVAFCQVHAWADSSTRAVAIVVSLLPVAGCVFRREFFMISKALGNERGRVVVGLRVHVDAPRVDYNYGAFGQELAVDPVV